MVSRKVWSFRGADKASEIHVIASYLAILSYLVSDLSRSAYRQNPSHRLLLVVSAESPVLFLSFPSSCSIIPICLP